MPDLIFDRRDGVAVLTLARPERLNAVTPGLVEELHTALDALAGDTATRIVILTGQGRGFCAGMDIQGDDAGPEGSPPQDGAGGEPEPEGRPQRIYRGIARGGEVVARLREIPQPVIAALHGPVAGMGVSFALACDFRIADPSTRFVSPFLNLGLSGGDVGLSWLLPRVVGPAKAAEILYRAQTLTAAQAHELGMLTEVTGEKGDLTAALKLAEELLVRSPYGLRHTKELLNLSLDGPTLRQHLAVENRTQTMAFFTEDFAEGVAAAMEKRPPRFRDR
ncbi:enoyl-CoA hydratase/isomerase family protein [Actinomadura sp. HBU206391]|uniref:enoyl-CoA hydratase/isomerase family protein n=1 Tax=Actinomadura sp. HBU206391 TaxID=2731692 RepID=UPI00164EDF49|nr:enoyl-CoA hydratase-related protein [Actinomadura sp. HBU206391]MBC6458298.1 enoyl-CoA hydratase/isomerase family protein [Actinomadura sp. HBU206391]